VHFVIMLARRTMLACYEIMYTLAFCTKFLHISLFICVIDAFFIVKVKHYPYICKVRIHNFEFLVTVLN